MGFVIICVVYLEAPIQSLVEKHIVCVYTVTSFQYVLTCFFQYLQVQYLQADYYRFGASQIDATPILKISQTSFSSFQYALSVVTVCIYIYMAVYI